MRKEGAPPPQEELGRGRHRVSIFQQSHPNPLCVAPVLPQQMPSVEMSPPHTLCLMLHKPSLQWWSWPHTPDIQLPSRAATSQQCPASREGTGANGEKPARGISASGTMLRKLGLGQLWFECFYYPCQKKCLSSYQGK